MTPTVNKGFVQSGKTEKAMLTGTIRERERERAQHKHSRGRDEDMMDRLIDRLLDRERTESTDYTAVSNTYLLMYICCCIVYRPVVGIQLCCCVV